MAAVQSSSRRRKTCFVTIGATTGFQDLISAVLHPDFAAALVSQQYTHLLVQHGLDGTESFKSESENLSRNVGSSLSIDGFGVDPNGLDDYFALAKGAAAPDDVEGVVISHAGSGTILAAMRLALPTIVVPNERLLDNHQVELAEVLEAQGYVVRGRVDALPVALKQSEQLRKSLHGWPPVNSGASGSLQGVMDEEMGFVE